ncbi:unnamed protein product [Mycena citricolor]|uniref:Uncharacterized protein n=1 Tax=Mycena citricolor TaxID=2018698 RepID=A0AAD2HD25_9AGAR|nr:unnamed protein product [Mycena citricolor]
MRFPSLRQLNIRAGTLGAETRSLVVIERSGPCQLETLVVRELVLAGKDTVYHRLTALLKLVPWLRHLSLDGASGSSGSDALFDDFLDHNDNDQAPLLPSLEKLTLNGISLSNAFIRFLEERERPSPSISTTLECLELKRVHETTTDVLQKIRKIVMQGGHKALRLVTTELEQTRRVFFPLPQDVSFDSSIRLLHPVDIPAAKGATDGLLDAAGIEHDQSSYRADGYAFSIMRPY